MNATTKNDTGIVPPLFSPQFQHDPYPTYRHYLQGAPLQPLEGRPGTWLLFGYEHCATAIRDARLSSVRPAASLVAITGDALAEFEDLVRHMQRWLLLRDAPRHSELRRLMNRGFTPAVMQGLRHKVIGIIDGLLDDMQNDGTVDLMKDFSYPLPVRVICELLGVPEELHSHCVVLSNDIAVWFGDVRRSPESARVAQQAIRELEEYFAAIIRERRGTRKDDLLSVLMDAAEGAGGLSEEDLHAQCVMLLFAGHETTRNLIGNGIYTLLKHPDTMRELRDDDSLWPAALEELLRYESPVQGIARGVKSDIDIAGTHLPAGSAIGFMIGAAHRDPRQFPDPDRLDVRRPHLRHLAFGGDAHVCLGITLARLEGQLSLTALTRRFPNLRLMDETPEWGSTFGLRGLKKLRVQI
jgi:cytochrome P450